jgi:hypothetical protein
MQHALPHDVAEYFNAEIFCAHAKVAGLRDALPV